MKILFTILIGLFLSITGYSQTCLHEGIIFTTQYQIDRFQIIYPNCTEMKAA